MRRRSADQLAARPCRLMSLAVEQDLRRRSAVSSRRMQRPVVVLPQPLSPTSPSVSPRRDREVDAVDRLHVADLARQHDAFGDREMHGEAAHLEQRRRARLALMPRTGARALPRRSALRKQAARWPGSPTGSSGGRAVAHCVDRRSGSAAGRRSRRRACVRSGGWPSTGSSRARRGWSSRGTELQQRRSCRDGAGRDRSPRRVPASTMRPAYMTFTRSA